MISVLSTEVHFEMRILRLVGDGCNLPLVLQSLYIKKAKSVSYSILQMTYVLATASRSSKLILCD